MTALRDKTGTANKGKRLYMGTVARFYIRAGEMELPECYMKINSKPSWAEMQKVQKSPSAITMPTPQENIVPTFQKPTCDKI